MPIQAPESYRAYCKDRAVQEAVDHIIYNAKSLHVPADLEWDDLPKFHRAVLAARQVQCEYAIFVHELWNAVWKPALDAHGIGKKLKPRTIADTEEQCNQKLDTYTLWYGWFSQVLDVADTNLVLCLGVGISEIALDKARLRISLQRDTGDNVDLDLGDDWRSEDVEDGWARTRKELAPIADDGSIDLDALRKAAADALAAIGSRLPAAPVKRARSKPAGGAKTTRRKAKRGAGG